MDDFSITQHGEPLHKSKYSIDLDAKTFSTEASYLVFDFTDVGGWTFKTGDDCTFQTGENCTFKTGDNCIFKTDADCTFKTGWSCTFNAGQNCTFTTGSYCTFLTGDYCTFDTEESCTFMVWYINTCKFKTFDNKSIILDRDDDKHYILTKELINMIKVING